MSIEANSHPRARAGQLGTFQADTFTHNDLERTIYRKGAGPTVIVMTEIPGITPYVLGVADHLVDAGFTAVLPDLFGRAGADPEAMGKARGNAYALSSLTKVCVAREFKALATGATSPIVDWLRALADRERLRTPSKGVGVIGMCFTGGFALAMAADDSILAAVASQPAVPFAVTKKQKRSIGMSERDLVAVAQRCQDDTVGLVGLAFKDDPLCPPQRFEALKERLGANFTVVELDQSDGNPDGPLPFRHSVLTSDLVDIPESRTREALEMVIKLFAERLT